MSRGPMSPPTLPMELMSAMPVAAAGPCAPNAHAREQASTGLLDI